MHHRLRPIYRGPCIAGTAVTCTVPPGDNWMIHVAAEQCTEGDILVVGTHSQAHSGYFGDLLGAMMKMRGVRGLVIDAGCRDVEGLEQIGFPVWSRCISAHGTVKQTLGDVNVPISCGETLVRPGDIIVADNDGVVVVPRLSGEQALEKSRARADYEARVRERYEAGELGLNMNNMRARLSEMGLRYVDQAEYEKDAQ